MYVRRPKGRKQAFTSIHGAHREHIHPVEESEDVRKALAECMDHHNGAAAAGGHHKDHHTDDAKQGSLQSEVAGGFDGRSHHGHNSPGALGWENAPGNEHGGCNHEEPGISGRILLPGGSSDEETETELNEDRSWLGYSKVPYFCDATHSRALEISSIEFLNGCFEVVRSFELNKPWIHC
ncbi:hypothetical protein EYZ11_005524 [Aspergillus tanneri]|uniref:Uncharacterized protein n=1 Tax=Aspergillus tanneri TaxID=1220188 RepID=A0A4S3JI49_9EURO|nr:hypothetical protein EYZ11_005524 [Aspergillus tanneri]